MTSKNTHIPGSNVVPTRWNLKFGERLANRRKELRLSQLEVAQKTAIALKTIQNYEAGDSPTGKRLVLLAKELGCTTGWLLMGEGPEPDPPGQKPESTKSIPIYKVGDHEPEHGPDRERFEPLDEFDYVNSTKLRFNAGDGAFVLEENIKKTHVFRKKWLNRIATSKENVLIIKTYGDSMEPAIFDGDTIMIDRGRNEIHSSYIYAIGIDETVMIKRLETLPGKTIRIISDNKVLYQPFEVGIDKIRVFGRVIWIAHQLVKG